PLPRTGPRRCVRQVDKVTSWLRALGRPEMGDVMSDREPLAFKDYKWIVSDPGLLGGKLAIRGTRFSVSFILSCLAEGMSVEEIQKTYAPFPHEAIPEIMKVAAEELEIPL